MVAQLPLVCIKNVGMVCTSLQEQWNCARFACKNKQLNLLFLNNGPAMSKHSSDSRQRRSRKYIDTHNELRGIGIAPHLGPPKPPKPRFTYSGSICEEGKQARKRQASRDFRSHGE